MRQSEHNMRPINHSGDLCPYWGTYFCTNLCEVSPLPTCDFECQFSGHTCRRVPYCVCSRKNLPRIITIKNETFRLVDFPNQRAKYIYELGIFVQKVSS